MSPSSFTCSDAFDLQFGVVIFRLRAGFDATERIEEKGNRRTTVCVLNHCYFECYMWYYVVSYVCHFQGNVPNHNVLSWPGIAV